LHDESGIPGVEPEGWIWAGALKDEHRRIPWHGDNEPSVDVPTNCIICGRKTESGIEVRANESSLIGFCSNRHYIEWWKAQHEDASISVDCYPAPDAPKG
jgi:hypothetical protein